MNALRYVVLFHDGIEEPHYDLMFETSPGSDLATWRSPTWPPDGCELTPLPTHRRAYLEYEGDLSNNRGQVQRIHAGTHQIIENDAAALIVRTESGRLLRLPR